jgi:hypothetical protein
VVDFVFSDESLQIWTHAAKSDLTYILLSTLNGTVIAFRDRETAMFYLSPVILGSQKPPEAPVTLTKSLVAVQIAAIEDCVRRAKEEGWDGSETHSLKRWKDLPGPAGGSQPSDSGDDGGGEEMEARPHRRRGRGEEDLQITTSTGSPLGFL